MLSIAAGWCTVHQLTPAFRLCLTSLGCTCNSSHWGLAGSIFVLAVIEMGSIPLNTGFYQPCWLMSSKFLYGICYLDDTGRLLRFPQTCYATSQTFSHLVSPDKQQHGRQCKVGLSIWLQRAGRQFIRIIVTCMMHSIDAM